MKSYLKLGNNIMLMSFLCKMKKPHKQLRSLRPTQDQYLLTKYNPQWLRLLNWLRYHLEL